MTEAMRAHLRLLQSGTLTIRTHYRNDGPTKHGSGCSRPPDAIANQRRAFIASHMERKTEWIASELKISVIAVRKHKRRIRAGELKVALGAKLRRPR